MLKIAILLAFFCASAGAQNVSPFNPPPFATPPATCKTGDIILDTSIVDLKFCFPTNNFRTVVFTSGVTSVVGSVPQWGGIFGESLSAGLPVSAFPGQGLSGAVPNALVETGAASTIDGSFIPSAQVVYTNDGGSPTATNQLAKISSTGTAALAQTTDTAIPIYITATVLSGKASLVAIGLATCQFDAGGATTAHFVVASTTTAGRCHDAGSAFPSAGWVIGIATQTVSGNANATVQSTVGDYAAASGGGSVTSIGFTTPTNGFTFTSNTTNPITSTGTITLGFTNENAGLFFAGPCSGAAASPTWRAMCFADLPGGTGTCTGTSGSISFDLSTGGLQTCTITGNVTAVSVSNGVTGKLYTFDINQGSGSFSFVWPVTFTGQISSPGVGQTASLHTVQTFEASAGPSFRAIAPGVINQ